MTKEIKIRNFIARITETRGKFNVAIVQVSNNGLQIVEDHFLSKFHVSTFNRAEKWALTKLA